MGIIAFIILGLLAGLIAKAIMPGSDPGGYIVTTIIGVVGALLGGFLAAAIFGAHPLDEFFDISTWLTAIIGSIILLALYRARRRSERRAARCEPEHASVARPPSRPGSRHRRPLGRHGSSPPPQEPRSPAGLLYPRTIHFD